MMRVIHKGCEREAPAGAHADLRALVDAALASATSELEIATAVTVDGREVALDALAGFALAGAREVRIESAPPAAIAAASLAGAAEYASRVRPALREIAGLLRTGELESANELFSQAADALSVLLYALASAAHHLGAVGQPLAAAASAAEPWLAAIVKAQEERDWVRVADYLEFELAPRVEEWQASCERVRDIWEAGRSPRVG
jgi:hypothetical protein